MLRWKVCGITRQEDAEAAVRVGADAIGFVFYEPSPRNIEPAQAARIARALPRETWRVGVFVNRSARHMERVADQVGLDFVQLSGDEPPQVCDGLVRHAFKALRLADSVDQQGALDAAARYPQCTLLVDAARDGLFGGSGEPGNWQAAAALAQRYRLLLAGGLNPDNVAAAIRRVKPWGVDVSSGVESRPGRKDPRLLEAFAQALEPFR